jgi:hypothetical protein
MALCLDPLRRAACAEHNVDRGLKFDRLADDTGFLAA